MSSHEIVVGNIGTVYYGDNYDDAAMTYIAYCDQSREPGHRCTFESVTWFKDGEIANEFNPETDWTAQEKVKALGGLSNNFDYALPLGWFKQACEIAGFNVSGHVVWSYETNRFGEPFAIDEQGREALAAIEDAKTPNPGESTRCRN